jgi:membrane protein implicated in regulation of membrane protease activity
MPPDPGRLGPQPRSRRGTVGHPYTALNLRLVLAGFGLVACGVLAVILVAMGYWGWAVLAGLIALTALVDLVVIQLRRAARRRADPSRHSLFE